MKLVSVQRLITRSCTSNNLLAIAGIYKISYDCIRLRRVGLFRYIIRMNAYEQYNQ